ncbi:MAG: hypothetical protein GTO18_00740 [Anaerolineales bacterium]|nr:hypothetical protein [Anaerolineales bacterium]
MYVRIVAVLSCTFVLLSSGCKSEAGLEQSQVVPTDFTAISTPTEPLLPDEYRTYSDETGIFSISYPSSWQSYTESLDPEMLSTRELVDSIESGELLEREGLILYLDSPSPNDYCQIWVGPLSDKLASVEEVADTHLASIQKDATKYRQLLYESLLVNRRESVILEYEVEFEVEAIVVQLHSLALVTKYHNTIWIASCAVFAEYASFTAQEAEFHTVLRSLKISR